MRYDLKLDFKRMETVKAEKGYHGPVVVCAIYFTPIAGYIPDRPVIKYLAAQRNIEIAFAPIAGTRILVPFRMVIPTPLGTAHAGGHPVHHHRRRRRGSRRRSEARPPSLRWMREAWRWAESPGSFAFDDIRPPRQTGARIPALTLRSLLDSTPAAHEL